MYECPDSWKYTLYQCFVKLQRLIPFYRFPALYQADKEGYTKHVIKSKSASHLKLTAVWPNRLLTTNINALGIIPTTNVANAIGFFSSW